MGNYAFGVDVGGTNSVTGLITRNGELKWKTKVPTEPEKGNERVVQTIAATIRQGLEETGISKDELVGAGIGMPGLIDTEKGIRIKATNLHLHHY